MRASGALSKMKHDFWKSAGLHLVTKSECGWLKVTGDYLRAYYARPELEPVETSCSSEIALLAGLMDDPFMEVSSDRLNELADKDAVDNFNVILSFRDSLLSAGTVEQTYLNLMLYPDRAVPALFISQMTHLILRNALAACEDPFMLRAAELFFRTQMLSNDEGRILLADEEVLEFQAQKHNSGRLGQLLEKFNAPVKKIELDVLNAQTMESYWQRSDRFDMILDFRMSEPGPDALAKVIEHWLAHLLGVQVSVMPREKIVDEHWRWHVGLDAASNEILNTLYRGESLGVRVPGEILALFEMSFRDEILLQEDMRGRPVYLALAANGARHVRMKPQNLITNLPLHEGS